MIDHIMRPIINPPLDFIAKRLVKLKISPDFITIFGFILGIIACISIYYSFFLTAIIFLLLNRLADGLDGAVARIGHHITAFGGYLDIVLDFFFYAGFVFAFIARAYMLENTTEMLAGAFLIYSFMANGSSFLAYAILAAKEGLTTEKRGKKSFFHDGGLAEGTETIITFFLLCLLPQYFTEIAWLYGSLCWLSAIIRIFQTWKIYKNNP